MGYDVQRFRDEQAPNPRNAFFKLEFPDFTLDFLPQIKAAIKFGEANQRKETVETDGFSIHFMGYADLIKDKQTSARKKDMEDIEQLKKIMGEK